MLDYYAILYADEEAVGVAYGRSSELLLLPYSGTVDDWDVPTLDLREGGFADYQPSNLVVRLCSARLRNVLEQQKSAYDIFQWLDVVVESPAERRTYYILHFPEPPDVLDADKTLFAGGDFVVKPVFSRAKVSAHSVFSYVKGGGLSLFVSSDVRSVLESHGLTGMQFSRTRAV